MLVDAHPGGPASLFVVDINLVGEGIGCLRGDGRDVVLVGVDRRDDFHGSGEEGLLHGAADFGSFWRPRC